MIPEVLSTCVLHGAQSTRWCAACDEEAGTQRDPWTGLEMTAEDRERKIIDALRSAGLDVTQVDLVLQTLARGNQSPSVSNEQLHRLLASVQSQSQSSPKTAPEDVNDAAAQLRASGWSEERIAAVLGA